MHDFTDLKKLMSKLDTDKVYLFIGNGPKKQYEDMHKVESSVRELLNNLGLRHSFIMRRLHFSKVFDHYFIFRNGQSWIAVFGGDTFKKEKPDLGAVMYFIKKEFNPALLGLYILHRLSST